MKRSANIAIFVPHAGCPHRCAFCDQRRISGESGIPSDGEISRTLTEAKYTLGIRLAEAEIAFFGGSFTAIPRHDMLRLLRAAQPFLGPAGFRGIRVSTRPDAVDGEILDTLQAHGVTAIELGAQSMDGRVLAACGRGHTREDVVRASGLIKRRGISLGLQMMTGLPMDTDETAKATAEALAALGPETVRIYPTLVLEHTALAGLCRAGTYRPQTLEEAVHLCADLLCHFTIQDISVIRLGLHDSPELRQNCLAGPYHPAFRELCESRVLLQKTVEQLRPVSPGGVTLLVGQGSTSRMTGQKRANLIALEKLGYRARIREEQQIPYLHVEVHVDRSS